MSYTVLGSSLDLLRESKNRWLCRSLLDGNRHMYMQMTWPGLFAVLQTFMHTTRLTYPNYLKDSKRFLNLMDETIRHAAVAAATQGEQPSGDCAIIDCMRRELSDNTTDEEIKTEAFALLRAGNEQQAHLSVSWD